LGCSNSKSSFVKTHEERRRTRARFSKTALRREYQIFIASFDKAPPGCSPHSRTVSRRTPDCVSTIGHHLAARHWTLVDWWAAARTCKTCRHHLCCCWWCYQSRCRTAIVRGSAKNSETSRSLARLCSTFPFPGPYASPPRSSH
jgi:hypothetical protein